MTEKQSFLEALSCNKNRLYYPKVLEPRVYKIVLDAIEQGVAADTVKQTIKQFSCLYWMRDDDDYSKIKDVIGADRFDTVCNTELLSKYMVVRAKSGAVLRSGPKTSAKRIGVLPDGTRVLVFLLIGQWRKDWVYIDSALGDGFVYQPLLEQY